MWTGRCARSARSAISICMSLPRPWETFPPPRHPSSACNPPVRSDEQRNLLRFETLLNAEAGARDAGRSPTHHNTPDLSRCPAPIRHELPPQAELVELAASSVSTATRPALLPQRAPISTRHKPSSTSVEVLPGLRDYTDIDRRSPQALIASAQQAAAARRSRIRARRVRPDAPLTHRRRSHHAWLVRAGPPRPRFHNFEQRRQQRRDSARRRACDVAAAATAVASSAQRRHLAADACRSDLHPAHLGLARRLPVEISRALAQRTDPSPASRGLRWNPLRAFIVGANGNAFSELIRSPRQRRRACRRPSRSAVRPRTSRPRGMTKTSSQPLSPGPGGGPPAPLRLACHRRAGIGIDRLAMLPPHDQPQHPLM